MPRGVYDHKHLKPKVYPAEMVAAVRVSYASGKTISEVAEELNSTSKVIWRLMQNHGIERRVSAKRNQVGSANHMWLGDNAGYQALHLRVQTVRGKPSCCEWCGKTDGRFEWANLTGDYADVDDYERLCAGCHRLYDASRRRETGRRTMPAVGGDAR